MTKLSQAQSSCSLLRRQHCDREPQEAQPHYRSRQADSKTRPEALVPGPPLPLSPLLALPSYPSHAYLPFLLFPVSHRAGGRLRGFGGTEDGAASLDNTVALPHLCAHAVLRS